LIALRLHKILLLNTRYRHQVWFFAFPDPSNKKPPRRQSSRSRGQCCRSLKASVVGITLKPQCRGGLIVEAQDAFKRPYQFASCQEIFTDSPNQGDISPQIAPLAVFLIAQTPWIKVFSGERIATHSNTPPAIAPLGLAQRHGTDADNLRKTLRSGTDPADPSHGDRHPRCTIKTSNRRSDWTHVERHPKRNA
jgi:hypothetical protein